MNHDLASKYAGKTHFQKIGS